MDVVAIQAEARQEVGKRSTKQVRNNGNVPCVLYGGDKPIHFAAKTLDLRPLIYTPDFKLADVTVDGRNYRTILKNVQFHPVTDKVIHADFQLLTDGQPVKVEVPVRFEGVSPGVRSGGTLVQKIRKVKLKTVPENLIDHVLLDISELELGDSVRVRDINVDDNIEIMNAPGIPLASVEIPRALRSAEAEAEAEAEGEGPAEGEESTEETKTEE